jgi:hypothetical protein
MLGGVTIEAGDSVQAKTKEKAVNEQTPVIKPNYCNLPRDVEGFDSLAELALDLRWSWNHCTDEVWRKLDSALWDLTQNPWVVLQTVSQDKLKSVMSDPGFRKKLESFCNPSGRRRKRLRGFKKIIRSRP